jgi:hypothetical protein
VPAEQGYPPVVTLRSGSKDVVRGLGTDTPKRQIKPGSHEYEFSPRGQYIPDGQSVQSVTSELPWYSEYEPRGQLENVLLPSGQYDPAGHMRPVMPSVGADTLALPMQ